MEISSVFLLQQIAKRSPVIQSHILKNIQFPDSERTPGTIRNQIRRFVEWGYITTRMIPKIPPQLELTITAAGLDFLDLWGSALGSLKQGQTKAEKKELKIEEATEMKEDEKIELCLQLEHLVLDLMDHAPEEISLDQKNRINTRIRGFVDQLS